MLRLIWDPVLDNAGVAHYRIYRGTSWGVQPTEEFLINSTPLNEYLDLALTPGTYYYYRISAVDFAGNEGEASAEIEQRTSSNYVFEGEWFIDIAFSSGDRFVIEDMIEYGEDWSNQQQFHVLSDTVGDFISLQYEISESDTYDVAVYFTKGPSYGIVNFQIDQTQL